MRLRVLAPLLILVLAGCGERDRYVQVSGYAQGGVYSVKVNLKGVRVPPAAVRDSIEDILTHIDTTLSGYNKGSQLSRFNAGEAIRPNALFLDMYRMAYRWYERSGGVLDFAAGPLFDAWGFGFREGALPSADQVRALLAECGMGRLPRDLPVDGGRLDPADLGFPRLNYNAIAQGYTCDLIARYLYGIGAHDMLVDIGEIWCDGLNPDGRPWSVGVDRPLDGNETPGADLDGIWNNGGAPCGIVTSGNYRKFYVRDGRKYAHSIDPRSGEPVQHNLLSATVVSSTGAADADALATWCMVVGLAEARSLLESDPELEGYLIYADGDGTMTEWATPGFTLSK